MRVAVANGRSASLKLNSLDDHRFISWLRSCDQRPASPAARPHARPPHRGQHESYFITVFVAAPVRSSPARLVVHRFLLGFLPSSARYSSRCGRISGRGVQGQDKGRPTSSGRPTSLISRSRDGAGTTSPPCWTTSRASLSPGCRMRLGRGSARTCRAAGQASRASTTGPSSRASCRRRIR